MPVAARWDTGDALPSVASRWSEATTATLCGRSGAELVGRVTGTLAGTSWRRYSWSACTGIPGSQFTKPYRAMPDPSIRRAKHVHGCVAVGYSCSATHRSIMGLVGALLGDAVTPG